MGRAFCATVRSFWYFDIRFFMKNILVIEEVLMNSNKSRSGNLFIISAPSGAGKTSLITALVEEVSNLEISLSYTTRAQRPGEVNGVHYNFISQAKYDELLAQDVFLESATVFEYNYGTSKRWIQERLDKGIDILLEIDWQGARQIKQKFQQNCVSIFVLPPSLAVLEARLRSRKQDADDVIAHRMEKAEAEISHYPEYDYLIINEDFERAKIELKSVITAERLRNQSQQQRCAELLAQF